MIRHPLVRANPHADELAYVAENIRDADRAEVEAGSGMTPLQALRQGRMISAECYTLYNPKTKEPSAIFGVVPATWGGGVVWLLGTDDIATHALAFHRGMRPQWEALARRWGVLANMVDARNKVHIRWLEWLGCEFLKPFPAGRSGVPFIPFIKRSHV